MPSLVSPDDAPGIFAKEFEDLVSLVAQNLSVEVRGSEHVQVLGVLNEFPCVQVDGGVQAQLGDAYGGETSGSGPIVTERAARAATVSYGDNG